MRLAAIALFEDGTTDYPVYVQMTIRHAMSDVTFMIAPFEFDFFVEEAITWCAKHCLDTYLVGSQQYVHFTNFDDAVLFRIAFS